MTSRERLYRKIKEELKKESGLKARVIAKRISEKKHDVNSILYCLQYRSAFRRDDGYAWYLAEDNIRDEESQSRTQSVTGFMTDVITVEASPAPISCKKCMLYKNDTCFGKKAVCEFFKNSPDISADEMAMWPKEMTGPYGTLHC